MDVVVLHGPRDARIEREPDLEGSPGPREIQIRTLVTALSSGTELTVYTGRYGDGMYGWPFGYPTEMGYLNVGRVVAVGEAVQPTEAAPWDVVYTFKPHRQEYRHSVDELFWKVPSGLAPERAAFAYLINLGLHALRRGGLQPGEKVAIVGLGPIGLAAAMLAKHFGSAVLAVDPVAERRALARQLGADLALDPTTAEFAAQAAQFGGETGIDLVVEAASTWSAVRTAAELVRQEGRISIVALHPGEAEFNPLGQLFYEKQYSLISTSFTPRADFPPERTRFTLRRNIQDILDKLAREELPYATAITGSIPHLELPALYERLAQGDRSAGAIAIHWE